MSLRLFVVPLLGMGHPDFPLATASARKRLIDIVVRKRSISINVVELDVVGG